MDMDNNQILQAPEPLGAPTHCRARPSNRFRALDDDISMSELSGEVMPSSSCLVDSPQDGEEVLRVVAVAELTAANGDLFLKRVRGALNGHAIIEIDLSRTTSIDCAGLGTLIAIRNFIRDRNGALRLLNPTAGVLLLLDLLCARSIFEIVSGIGVFCPSATSSLPHALSILSRSDL